MATGRVLQFDEERGYGFIAADDGGEDVFLHASVFEGESRELVPGAAVEFETMAGDRGRKAFGVHLLQGAPGRSAPGPAELDGQVQARATADADAQCDVLSEARFGQEITEILLESAPDIPGKHILQVRQSLITFGRKHGWIDSQNVLPVLDAGPGERPRGLFVIPAPGAAVSDSSWLSANRCRTAAAYAAKPGRAEGLPGG